MRSSTDVLNMTIRDVNQQPDKKAAYLRAHTVSALQNYTSVNKLSGTLQKVFNICVTNMEKMRSAEAVIAELEKLNHYIHTENPSGASDALFFLKMLRHQVRSFDFYEKYGIAIHPTTTKEKLPPVTDANPGFSHYPKGLPKALIDLLQEDPTYAVVYVSGGGINTEGHALIFLGKAGFVHIDAVSGLPKFMTIEEFNDYIVRNGKFIIGIQSERIEAMNDFILNLDNAAREPWKWFVVKHNCVTFCKDLLAGGKSDIKTRYDLLLSLPKRHFLAATDTRFDLRVKEESKFNKEQMTAENLLLNADIADLKNYVALASCKDVVEWTRYMAENTTQVLLDQIRLYHTLLSSQATDKMERDILSQYDRFVNNNALRVSQIILKELQTFRAKIESYKSLYSPEELAMIDKSLREVDSAMQKAVLQAREVAEVKTTSLATASAELPSINLEQTIVPSRARLEEEGDFASRARLFTSRSTQVSRKANEPTDPEKKPQR